MTIFGIPEELLETIKPTASEPLPEGPLREVWLLGELEWALECLHSLCFDDLCTWQEKHRLRGTRERVKKMREEQQA